MVHSGTMGLISLRASLPDRPGMLAAVASAVSETACDIVTIEVVSRAEGQVVDDLCVDTGPVSAADLRRIVEQIPGVAVEFVHAVGSPPPAVATLELAWSLIEADHDRVGVLVDGLPSALHAEWAMALEQRHDDVRRVAASLGAPEGPTAPLPWMPLAGPDRLTGSWMPTSWHVPGIGASLEIAASPLGRPTVAVVVARSGGRFRPPELRQIEILSALTVRGPQAIGLAPPPVLRW
jgi:hypothetical protein